VLGGHDGHLRQLTLAGSGTSSAPSVVWDVDIGGKLFSSVTTAVVRGVSVVVCAVTTGSIFVRDADTGTAIASLALPSEVFSSPVMLGHFIFVGCRDNYLYCKECT
jgi:hypothetical protein